MKSKNKARLVTALICVLLTLMFADLVALFPWSLPYILGAFAIPGAWKFARCLYIWLMLDDPALDEIHFPWKKKKEKTYRDYAEVPK